MWGNSLFYRQWNFCIWLAVQTSYMQYVRSCVKRHVFTGLKNDLKQVTDFETTCCAGMNL
jgi:DNA-binding PucR family transcriptional regulator